MLVWIPAGLLTLLACSQSPATHAIDAAVQIPAAISRSQPIGYCETRYAPPEVAGQIEDHALREVSGIAASRQNPGVLWLHGDSGSGAVIHALNEVGMRLGTLRLRGVRAVDFEDIAAAPCPDREHACLWLADTGDNNHSRTEVAVYAVQEPRVLTNAPFHHVAAERVWKFPLRYPDEPIDSEALIVMPDLSALYLFEKTAAREARVYRLDGPFRENETGALQEIARFRAPGVPIRRGRMITAADLHPEGDRLLIRVYSGSFEFKLGQSSDLSALASLKPTVVALGPLSEPQGEAIAYDHDGRGLWTVSESRDPKAEQPLHHYPCEGPAGRP